MSRLVISLYNSWVGDNRWSTLIRKFEIKSTSAIKAAQERKIKEAFQKRGAGDEATIHLVALSSLYTC